MLYIQIQDDCWVKGKEFYAGDLKKFPDFDTFIKSGWAPQAILGGHAEIAKRFEWDNPQYWNTSIPFDFVQDLKTKTPGSKSHFASLLREHALNVTPWTPFINMHVEEDKMHMQWTVISYPMNPKDYHQGVPKDAALHAVPGSLKHSKYKGPPRFSDLDLNHSDLQSHQKRQTTYNFDEDVTHIHTWIPVTAIPKPIQKAAIFGSLYGMGKARSLKEALWA